MKVMVKRVGKPAEIVNADATYRFDCKSLILQPGDSVELEELVSGYGGSRLGILVDEEGMLKNLPENIVMPIARGMNSYSLDTIYGDVVIFRYLLESPGENGLWDYKLTDLSEADIRLLKKLVDLCEGGPEEGEPQ